MRRAFICLFVVAALAGCTDNPKDTSRHEDPRFSDIWPHDDGLSWLFDFTVESYPDFSFYTVEDPEDLPHLPPMSVLAAYLEDYLPDQGEVVRAYYELLFDGTMTTLSGAEGQRLREAIYEKGFAYPNSSTPGTEFPQKTGFWRSLAQARPDLRAAIAEKHPEINLSPAAGTIQPPVLMAGGAWDQTATWIGNYGDVDLDPAWIYLTPDLDPGASFRLQLIPALADDVFLDGLVLDWIDLSTAVGDFKNCVEVLYRIDYGATEILQDGSYFRAMGYGLMIYAPGVGPVYCLDRDLCNLLDPYDCAREIESSLVAYLQR